VESLLGIFKEGSSVELRPSLDPATGQIAYAAAQQATGLDVNATRGLLEKLSQEGILRKGTMESFHACPRCSSKLVVARLRCPYCRGEALTAARAIEHFRCGRVDIEGAFSSSGRKVCPECKKELKALGVDYRFVTNQHGCLTCGRLVREPKWTFVCATCNSMISPSEVRFERYYIYTLDPEARDRMFRYAPALTRLKPVFEKHGFYAKFETPVRGRSGVEHHFAIAAWRQRRQSDEPPDILLKMILSQEPLSVRTAMSVVGETVDVGGKSALMVAVPGFTADAIRLASFYGVAAWGFQKAEAVLGELERLLPEELQRLGGRAGKKKSDLEAKKAGDVDTELLLDFYRKDATAREQKVRLESMMRTIIEGSAPPGPSP
jgi:hypothetical protein